MENNYLDKKLREILENPPHFEPPVSAIEDMRARLKGNPEKKKGGLVIPLWWPFLLAIPILFGGLFFVKKYQTLNKKFDDLNLQFADFQRDTLINKTVVYHFDTVYTKIYKDVIIERRFEKVTELAGGDAMNGAMNDGFFKRKNWNLFGQNDYSMPMGYELGNAENFKQFGLFYPAQFGGFGASSVPAFSNEGDIQGLNKVAEIEETGSFENPDFLKYLSLNDLKMGKIDPRLNDKLNDAKPSFKKPKKNLIYYFQPVGASVGITASTLFANLPQGLERGSSLGVVGELHFMKNVHLQLGVERLSIGFKMEDDGIVGSYPIANPDDPSDVLHEIKGNLSYLQIPIELKKMFRDGKKIQPYFHFGLSAVRPLKQNFDYEYKSFPGEYKTQLNLKDGAFSIGHLRGGIGGAFSFWGKYTAGMGAYYQHGLEIGEGEYFKLRYWGLQANLKYQLF